MTDAPQPSKDSTLIAENIVMRWRGGLLTEVDVPLVLDIAAAIDTASSGPAEAEAPAYAAGGKAKQPAGPEPSTRCPTN